MRIEKHPYNYPIEKNFPLLQRLVSFEGGSLWLAEKDGRYYVIVDEGTMADFLIPSEDDDLLNEMVKIYEFDSESDRQQYIQEQGWNNRKERKLTKRMRNKIIQNIPTSVDFQKAIDEIFRSAQQQGLQEITIKSGDLHRRVGGYPSNNHRMAVCCYVMRANMHPGDQILTASSKGDGATLEIRDRLPR